MCVLADISSLGHMAANQLSRATIDDSIVHEFEGHNIIGTGLNNHHLLRHQALVCLQQLAVDSRE
jgi:hypothetical protein